MSYSDILRRNMPVPQVKANVDKTVNCTWQNDNLKKGHDNPPYIETADRMSTEAIKVDSNMATINDNESNDTVTTEGTTGIEAFEEGATCGATCDGANEVGDQETDFNNSMSLPFDKNEKLIDLRDTMNINLSTFLAKKVFGYNFNKVPSLIEKLKKNCSGVYDLNLYVTKDMKKLKIYCHANQDYLDTIKRELEIIFEKAKKNACQVNKVPYICSDSGAFIIMDRGANIKDIDFNNDGRTLLVFKEDNSGGMDSDALLKMLDEREDVVSVWRFDNVTAMENNPYRLWGKIKCIDVEAGERIINFTKAGYDGWRARLPAPNNKDKDGTLVKLSYFPDASSSLVVDMGQYWQFLPFPDKISVCGYWCKCTLHDDQRLKVDLSKVPWKRKTNLNGMKLIVKDYCESYLNIEPLSIESWSGDVTLRSYHFGGFYWFINDVVSSVGAKKDDYRIHMNQKQGEVANNVTAEVHFDDRNSANAFLAKLKSTDIYKTYKNSPLSISSLTYTKKNITKTVFEATKIGLEIMRKGVCEKRDEMNVEIVEKSRGGALITVSGPSLSDVQSVKQVLERIISPQQIICLKECSIQLIKGVFGRKHIRLLEKQLDVKINCDETRRTVNIYGPPNMKAIAYDRLVNFLNTYYAENTVINLSTFGINVCHLVASLMKQYGRFLEGLCSVTRAKDVYLDIRNYDLHVCGKYGKVVDQVKSLLNAHVEEMKKQNKTYSCHDVQCVACLCPIDTVPYKLEFCGHAYCRSCLEMQLSVATQIKEFPIRCVEDGCREEITWNDITSLLRHNHQQQQDLIQAAVSLFVAQNKDRFRHCVTPDCSMVYRVSAWSESKQYECPICQTGMCRTCHVLSHEGMSCGVYKAQAHMDDKLKAWLLEDTANRDVCPKCAEGVEKNGGCQNVHCYTCKTSICWRCKAHFEISSECYEHLNAVHGSYY